MTFEHEARLDLRQDSNRLFGAGFFGGVIGALLLSLLFAIFRTVGFTNLNFEMSLGSMLTQDLSQASWGLGFAWHCLNGGIFGLIYAGLFRAIGHTGPSMGASLGIIHWAVAGWALGLMPNIHPLIPQQLPIPGWFGTSYGVTGVVGILFGHVIYGVTVGVVHSAATRKLVLRRTGGMERVEEAPRRAA